jgi:CBS domain-containing protein
MNVEGVMTKDVAICRATDSLHRAGQIMWEGRCGCVPVLDDDRRVVGMLSDRDVSMAAYTQGRRLDELPATIAMSRFVQGCSPASSIEEAEDLMMAHAVHRLVVVDADGRLCGLISLDDIAKHAAAWDGKGDIDLERVALTLGEIARRNSSSGEEGPEAEIPETDLSDLVQNSLSALKSLRDEVRVELDLAGMELRDRWRRLEARLHAAETRARGVRRGGARSLANLVDTARQFRRLVHEQSTSAPPPH